MEIRTAAPADATGLADLLRAAGQPVPAHALAERLDAIRYAHGTALLALEWGPPSGFVVLHWYPTLDQPSPVAQITTLVVGPDERRRGIGRQLLKAASQAARMAGCGTLQIGVPMQEASAQAFCVATGFEPVTSGFSRSLRKKN